MQTLTPENRRRAVEFLHRSARPLESALYDYANGRGSAEAVLGHLAAFQLDGGGYGRALEADAQHPDPSVLDTTTALQVHQRLDTPRDHPQVRAALTYLRSAYDPRHGVWPIRPAIGPDVPSAPWWKADPDANRVEGCRLNPTAEVLAWFLEYGGPEDAGLIQDVSSRVRAVIDAHADPLEMHDLLCVSRLSQAEGLDDAWRAELVERVRREVAAMVSADPQAWDTYGLKPWTIAETPGDPRLAGLEPGLLDAMLDHEIDGQGDNGGWPPFWDWGGLHPEAWATAKAAWTGVLTEQMLRVLPAFGRG